MTDACMTQDDFILPAPPVGGLPISQDGLDRMKLVRDRTIPIILPNGENVMVKFMFRIIIVYTNYSKRQLQGKFDDLSMSLNKKKYVYILHLDVISLFSFQNISCHYTSITSLL